MRDQYDDLFDEPEDWASLMGAEDLVGVSGATWRDGFVELHEVRVTEPWRPSLVRLDERPRVSAPTSVHPCAQCARPVNGIKRQRYCGAEDCNRARAAARKRAERAQ